MKIDWVAEHFTAMRDCGEDVSIVYGQIDEASVEPEPRWFELPHDKFDGISGLAKLLRDAGLYVDKLPVLSGDRFTFFRALRGFLAFLPAAGIWRQQWKHFDPACKVSFISVNKRVVWHLFSEEQTKKIITQAKAEKITVNTYLLYKLDLVVASELTKSSSNRRWMIPVNLRGAVVRTNEASPHMSFMGVDFDQDFSLIQLHEQITQLKKKCYHWGTWAAFSGSFLLGIDGIRRDICNRQKKGHSWTGIFSNLGSWEVQNGGSWFFCPAVSRFYPVGAGCMTMNGRLAMTIQLHEALRYDVKTLNSVLEAWKQACL